MDMTLSLIVPFYNEEEAVEKVSLGLISEFKKNGINLKLILVNNGSADGTTEILQRLAATNSGIKIVTIPVNEGFGWGVISGLKKARGEYLGFTCGDGQISAPDTVKIYQRLVRDGLELCKAKRTDRKDGLLRKITSKVYNFTLPLFFPVQTRDVNSNPKIMNRKSYRKLRPSCKDWFLDAEIMIKSRRLGLKVGEVPVTSRYRAGGSSKVRVSTVFEFLKNLFKYRIRGFD
jgi:dolichol-phosphate mannosyltransferase